MHGVIREVEVDLGLAYGLIQAYICIISQDEKKVNKEARAMGSNYWKGYEFMI